MAHSFPSAQARNDFFEGLLSDLQAAPAGSLSGPGADSIARLASIHDLSVSIVGEESPFGLEYRLVCILSGLDSNGSELSVSLSGVEDFIN